MSLINHLEKHLGSIEQGWKLVDGCTSINVVRFVNVPFDSAMTYVTLGLNNYPLSLSETRHGRQELLFTTYERFPAGDIASFIITFAEYMISKRQALLRGDVVGPSEPLITGVSTNAVYSTVPVIFDDALATYDGTDPPTVIVWLLPLLSDEAEFVKKSGWNSFEDLLESENPDLFDLNRSSVVS